jgi:hypothetical protein
VIRKFHRSRSALLALALAGIEVRAVDETLGKRSGELLARAKKSDVIDAALVLLSTEVSKARMALIQRLER